MAGWCRLPKVIVVFALLLQINCDLLDQRVRQSKSNDPEVQDFLRSVLKHRSDFKWIGHEVRQHRHVRDLLPLNGVSPKNKRYFYSTNGAYPSPMKYGYKHIHESRDTDNEEKSHFRPPEKPHPTSQDTDFEGPVNDVYPYDENLNAADDHRFVRETQDNFLYDDNPQRTDYNFLDEGGPGELTSLEGTTESGGFLEPNRVPAIKRDSTTEQLLDHKMVLHKVLDTKIDTTNFPDNSNSGRDVKGSIDNKNDDSYSWKNFNNNYDNDKILDLGNNRIGKQSPQVWNLGDSMPGDAIEVIPSSMNGVKYAPGLKYEKFSEYGKSDDEEQYEGGGHKVFKRKCDNTLQETDFKVPELFNNTNIDDAAQAEFYYAVPHDILGINQDISNEQKTYNTTCKKIRSLNWEQLIAKAKGPKKKLKNIKIKIFDDDQMVKDIQKDEKRNSIVLKINGPVAFQTENPPEDDSEKNVDGEYITALDKYSDHLLPIYRAGLKHSKVDDNLNEDKDYTLEKIDSILKHDKASLKQKDLINNISEVIAQHRNVVEFLPSTNSATVSCVTKRDEASEENSDSDTGATGTIKEPKEIIHDDQVKQNRLEDLTEPTSAAEQRELGKINNNFNTRPMGGDEVTTEKIIVIPLKKSPEDSHKKKISKPSSNNHKQRRVSTPSSWEQQVLEQDKHLHKNRMHKTVRDDQKDREFDDVINKLKDSLIHNVKRVTRFPRNIPKELKTLKADAFRSRKLFAYEEEDSTVNNIEESPVGNTKDVKINSEDSSVNHVDNQYDEEFSRSNRDSKESSRSFNKLEDFPESYLDDVYSQYDEINSNANRNPADFASYDTQYLQDNLEETNEPSSSYHRSKKDIRKSLGMKNDEDYSEDRSDIYATVSEEKPKRKIEKKNKTVKEKSKLGSLVNSQEEKRAFKGRIAHTKPSKVKKEISSDNSFSKGDREEDIQNMNYENMDDVTSLDKTENYRDLLDQEQDEDLEQFRLDSKNEELAKISRKAALKTAKHLEEENKHVTEHPEITTKIGDRCCENKNSSNSAGGDTCHGPPTGNKPEEKIKIESFDNSQDEAGNELDIIERTQAIMLHLTGRPPITTRKENSSNNGNIDENDYPDNKLRSDTEYRNSESSKNTDNVVSEIIQLVQNYKDKVNEYKKNNHLDETTLASVSTKLNSNSGSSSITSEAPTSENTEELKKNVRHHHPKHPNIEKTTISSIASKTNQPTNINNNVIADHDEESSFHQHALMKAKKLHPLKEVKCENKEGKDIQIHEKTLKPEQDFISPSIIVEGFVKPEVVAESIPEKDLHSRSEHVPKKKVKMLKNNKKQVRTEENSDYENELESLKDSEVVLPQLDQLEIRSAQSKSEPEDSSEKNIQKRNQENPMSFTPDNLASFKEIIESGKRLQRQQMKEDDNEDDEIVTAGTNSFQEKDNRYKRDLEDDYTNEELDKLLSLVNDASVQAQKDKEKLKRYRRYRNYEPFYYENLPKLRQVSESESTTAKVESTAAVTNAPATGPGGGTGATPPSKGGGTSHTEKMVCPIDECDVIPNPNQEDTERKHKKKKAKCEFAEEYGDTSKGHSAAHRKLSKSEANIDAQTRQKTRDKILRDKLIERQKEQEHIKNVLNGHLILDIMDKFQKKLKENGHLYSRFGQSLGKKCAADQVKFIDEFNTEQSKADVRHAQLMLHQVIVLLNKIVAEQVHRRTCLILSPTLRNYLKRIAVSKSNIPKSTIIAEGYPLPALKGNKTSKIQSDDKQGDFLFTDQIDEEKPKTPLQRAETIRKKINIIRTLLNKYKRMSHSCQVQVEPVREYLAHQLELLQKLERDRKYGEEEDVCDTRQNKTETAPSNPPHGARSSQFRKHSRGAMFDPYFKYDEAKENGNSQLSEKYKKLIDAAASFRRKRQIEERLARLFGDKRNKRKNVESTTFKIETKKGKLKDNNLEEEDNGEEQLRKVAFEAPVVYSLH